MKSWLLALCILFLSTACMLPPRFSSSERICKTSSLIRIDAKFTAAEREQIFQGLGAWSRASKGSICFSEAGRPNKGWTFVILRLDFQRELAPYDDEWEKHAGIYHPGIMAIAMDKSAPYLDAVIAHEAGHFLGHDHNSDEHSIMHNVPAALDKGELPTLDIATYLTK